MHFGQRACQILDQFREGPLYRAPACDQHIIIAVQGVILPGEPYGLFEPSAGPVADDGAPEAFRRGKPEPCPIRGLTCAWRPPPRLKHVRGRREAGAAFHEKELWPCLKSSDVRHRAGPVLSRQTLAPFGPAPRDDFAAAFCGHPGAKTVAPFADEPRGLIGAFQGSSPGPRPMFFGSRKQAVGAKIVRAGL